MKNLRSEITINAKPAAVWEILMDHEAYPDWNPFIKKISGTIKKGENISVTLQPEDKKPMVFKPIVLNNDKDNEFRWKGKLFIKGLFDGEHYFKLERMGNNQTRFIHGENFSGILSGLLLRMIGESTLRSFIAMNEALKLKAEIAS